jgi:hypothetical protein
MTIKKLSLIALVIFVLTLPMAVTGADGDFKPGSEPDGFRGIKWGTDVSTLKDMELKSKRGLYAFYTRRGDVLQIGSSKPQSIVYIFWDGKLSTVQISTEGNDEYNRLKESTFDKFGKGKLSKDDDYPDDIDFIWHGKLTLMRLSYTQKSKEVVLSMRSAELFNKERLYKQQKARENAK